MVAQSSFVGELRLVHFATADSGPGQEESETLGDFEEYALVGL